MKFLKTLGLLFLICLTESLLGADFPIDLNSASLEEIKQLPISPEKAIAIYEYRQFRSYFKSFYDLMRVPGIGPDDLEILRPIVRIEPVQPDYLAERMSIAQRSVRMWGSSEGSNEGLIDLWIDIAKDPPNINTAGVYDLMNLQNLSPVDAVAIVNHRKAIGLYQSRRDLRYTPGLSGWGYMNARSLVKYRDTERAGDFYGRYQLRLRSSPTDPDIDELMNEDVYSANSLYQSWNDRLGLFKSTPEMSQKLYGKYYLTEGVTLRGGLITWRRAGGFSSKVRYKGFIGFEGTRFGGFEVKKLYIGDFLVGFGQGLVMENGDYFKSRKSGYSYDKRYYGIIGDMSRSEQYKLSGVATEVQFGNWKALGFYSDDRKDAVLNDDGSVFSYIMLDPAIDNGILVRYGLPAMKDAVRERTYGGNLRYSYATGSHIGFSGYESRYNRRFDPKDGGAVIGRFDRIVPADNEVFNLYKSPGKFRRIFGIESQTVFRNHCLQAEYAEMDIDGKIYKLGDDPKALVVSLWSQYSNLDFLALYRSYDLAFDNPYCRGFSNYERFKGTIIEDQYYLTDPLYGLLFENAVTPQAERGVYFSSRYRLTQSIIPRFEYDRWKRASDGASYYRFVGNLEVRFVYPLRFKIRQQFQGRDRHDKLTPTSYGLNETRLELEMRLSDYDMVEFTYIRGGTEWPPRPRLVGGSDADGDHPASGQAYQPTSALLVHAVHNFTEAMALKVGAISYDGFVWFFEESDFIAADNRRSLRFWASIEDHVSDRLWIELKAAFDRGMPITNIDIRRYNEEYGAKVDADQLVRNYRYFRLQIDYLW